MISFRLQINRVAMVFVLALGVLAAPAGNTFTSGTFTSGIYISSARAEVPEVETPGDSAKLLENVARQIARGRGQLEGNQSIAVDTLRKASQQSLNALAAYIGPEVLTAPPEKMPQTGIWAAAVRQAGEAHYWWGRAAEQFGTRDEAITAFARAARFAGRVRPNASDLLPRDSMLALSGVLRDGLPVIAPDDTLTTISEIAYGKLWTPRRFSFQLPQTSINLNPPIATEEREFLITTGRVYPPVPSSTVDTGAALSRVPPIYRSVAASALPGVLRHDRMVIGYFKEVSGADKGLWRQVVCVFYASTYLTRGRRDDRLRAEALCAQFLKVRALVENKLGLSNSYNRDGITNLWLSEVTSLWPKDDDDPRVRDMVGVQMPKINTPTTGNKIENREIDVEPTSYPWLAGTTQTTSAPGDILLFQMPRARVEAEWLREIMHEYGHVSLPAFDGFKAPLEPYANGGIGEILGMIWVASAPAFWNFPADFGITSDDMKFAQSVRTHVENQALPAWRAWKSRGPISPLRRDTTRSGLQYLQGLTVYAERVYGANILGAALSPLTSDAVKTSDTIFKPKSRSTESLMASFSSALSDPFSEKGIAANGVLPIWLPGALDGVAISTEDFISRANLKVKAGTKFSGWLYVPPRARFLHLEWMTETVSLKTLQSDDKLPTSRTKAVSDFAKSGDAANFDVRNKTGWQRLSFTAHADLELVAAQFEK